MLNNCRVCLCDNINELKNFSHHITCNGLDISIQQAFEECTQIAAQSDDLLCQTCTNGLQDFWSFLVTAKASDAQLRLHCIQYDETKVDEEPNKDPLEDPLNVELVHVSNTDVLRNNESTDTDEDKPLSTFIKSVSDSSRRIAAATDNEESDVGSDNENNFTQSIEAQIFPQGTYACDICHKSYFTASGLNAHQDIHLPKSAHPKRRRLRKTNEATGEHEALATIEAVKDIKEHALNNSNSSNLRKAKTTKLFPCQYCGKQMISASKLRYHLVMHTGEKNFLCTMCPKAYSTIYALKHHMRIHTGERPYECKFCGDRFLRPTTLKSHMRRHTGERPYGCEICGKRFIQHSSMATHMKLNHMDKTIACPHCDKKYARKTDLNTHLLSHTGDKPFACQLCNSRFIRQANLNKHMNQHHAGFKATEENSKHKTSTISNVISINVDDSVYNMQTNLLQSTDSGNILHDATRFDLIKANQM